MGVKLAKPSLDVGLVTCNEEAALSFYRDMLGLPEAGMLTLPGIGVIRRFQVGDSILRIVVAEKEPLFKASTEGFISQTGLRYLTLTITNLDDLIARAKKCGFEVPVDIMTLRPGTRVAQIQDPDGNTVELMQIEDN